MATSTPTLIDLILAELESHLPALLTAQSLDHPRQYLYGDPDFTPTTQTPTIAVDIPDLDQEAGLGGGGKRGNSILVYILLSAPNPQTLSRSVDTYVDLIVKVLESEVVSGTAKLAVDRADFTPTLSGANRLFGGACIEASLSKSRNRGDS